MKIYTIQKIDFLDTIDNNGYIKYDKYDSDDSIFYYDETIKALKWLNNQFTIRMDTPLDRNLIWVWPIWQPYFKDELFNRQDYRLYIFEVPMQQYKTSILWSDFFQWHDVLNQLEDSDYEQIFDINIKHDKSIIQGVTTRLNISWLKAIKSNTNIR